MLNVVEKTNDPTTMNSRSFGCFWDTMFLVANNLYEHFDPSNPQHIQQKRNVTTFLYSIPHVLPCKFCRQYCMETIIPNFPLNFSGRLALMYSLYLWKDQVNKKLLGQGVDYASPSPPFGQVLQYYDSFRASCNPVQQTCDITRRW